MTTPQLARIDERLRKLRLHKLRERLEGLLQEAIAQECSYADFLDRVLSEEAASKREKQVAMHTTMARFPYVKTLEAFDFSFQPSIDRKKIHELATGQYLDRAENIVLLGPPDTGKTHLAVALGLKPSSKAIARSSSPPAVSSRPWPRPTVRIASRRSSSTTPCRSS